MKESENKRRIEINSDHSGHHKRNTHNHTNHIWLMLVAHVVPIVLIIILPMFGFSGSWTFIAPLVLFVALHIWMIKSHVSNN